jgi:hypothetical protein
MKSAAWSCLVVAALLLSAPSAFGDGIGRDLRDAMVWTDASPDVKGWLHAGFRRDLQFDEKPREATIHLFAYTRYTLFVNGQYVGRGPNRFENRRPEYDSWPIASYLRAGRNCIAVVAHRDWPGEEKSTAVALSRMRLHALGFAARIDLKREGDRIESIRTDANWIGFTEPTFGDPNGRHYASIPETIDARLSPGDWKAPEFDASAMSRATRLDTGDAERWPELEPRTIPLLRERPVEFSVSASEGVEHTGDSYTLSRGQALTLKPPRAAQVYTVIELDAEEGTEVHTSGGNRYTCRAGLQTWIGGDTFGLREVVVRVVKGRATIRSVKLVEVLYPFDRIGRFSSSDPLLDRIWAVAAASQELLSEDAYTDCGDRERSEWMDCDPPMFDATRTMHAGPGDDGKPLYADPRLLKNMLIRVAMSQEPSGHVRARTCSEVIDVHTIMEDRACEWVHGIRRYYEATGDKALVAYLFPFVERQLQWFLDRRTVRGLVRAREWCVWDNPLRYGTCEGTALNAFVYGVLADASYLAAEAGMHEPAARYGTAATELRDAMNRVLWSERDGAYFAGHGVPEVLGMSQRMRPKGIDLPMDGDLILPTFHANLFALDQGIVPADRRARVIEYVRRTQEQAAEFMSQHYLAKLLYSLNDPQADRVMLDQIRKLWAPMANAPEQTTWEKPNRGSKMHCYGIAAGPMLSRYVLGVRRDEPAWKRELTIEPHLADLSRAEGVVVTEFGPVEVSWKVNDAALSFELSIPENVKTTLRLIDADAASLRIDGQPPRTVDGTAEGRSVVVDLSPGRRTGTATLRR